MFLLRPFRAVFNRARRTLSTIPDAIESILILPTIAEQLAVVRQNTDALPGVLAALQGVKEDTSVLPALWREVEVTNSGIAVMKADTEALVAVTEPLAGAAERLGRWDDRLPRRNGARRFGR